MPRNIRFTPKQKKIFEFIRAFMAENGYSPSINEIREHMGLSAVSTVHEHLSKMTAKGLLRRDYHLARSTELAVSPPLPSMELPLMDTIVEGEPEEPYLTDETVSVPSSMVGRGKHFALRAMGHSMRDDHIADGDILVVRETSRAAAGDLVVAVVEDYGTTVKRFYPEGDLIRLQPSNRSLRPIRVDKSGVEVQGIVVGLLRRYTKT